MPKSTSEGPSYEPGKEPPGWVPPVPEPEAEAAVEPAEDEQPPAKKAGPKPAKKAGPKPAPKPAGEL